MQRGSLVLVLLALALTGSQARNMLQQSSSAFCPDACQANACVQDATTAGLRCQKCMGNLIINKVNGKCACAAGYYANDPNAFNCAQCPKGSFCPGKDWVTGDLPIKVACPDHMTTLGLRSTTNRACVNLPGYSYTVDTNTGAVGAVECPVDTYSAGLKKQRACVPCPTGYTTDGKTGRTSPSDCLVPAGYYLKAPGQIAPCPMGEWKTGTGPQGNCTKCAFGVTTLKEGSTSETECKVVVAGNYPSVISGGIVKATKVCPQKYYCPGGVPTAAFDPLNPSALSASEPTIKLCPSGLWTIDIGSISAEQCLTPPGYYTAAGATAQCAAGSYRADWKALGDATTCTPCGDGVFADKTDQLTVYDIATYAVSKIAITTSSDDCYISPGQGLYYATLTSSWRSKNCDTNNYGVNNRTYGLTAYACRDCPTGQITSTNAAAFPNSASYYVTNADGTKGFVSAKACVNKPGYGYDGRVSQPCPRGTYSPADSYGTCTACAYGLTTADVAAGVTEADCGMAQGFGLVKGVIRPCAVGTYNNASYTPSKTAACTACPAGTTTTTEGGDSADSCNMCLAGFGGPGCGTQCGGAVASYGPVGRAVDSPCIACTTQTTGYSFSWQMGNDLYISPAIAKPGASAATDCLAQYSQIADGSWYLPLQSQTYVTNSTVTDFASCVALCVAPCQLVNYDYRTNICSVRSAQAPKFVGAPMIAFKALVSGDVGTNAWSVIKKVAAKNAVASGQYTFYQEPNALDVGIQEPAPGAAGFKTIQDCLNACDEDRFCAGITMLMNIAVDDRPTTCALIKGDTSVGKFIRTVTRADTSKIAVPVLQ